MGMHVVPDKCPICKRKGLVIGGVNFLMDEPVIFRPKGWVLDRLECLRAVCAGCGYIVEALTPRSLKRLRAALKEERLKETVTYHSKGKRKRRNKSTDGDASEQKPD